MTEQEQLNYAAALELQTFKRGDIEGWIFYIDLEQRIAFSRYGQALGRVVVDKEGPGRYNHYTYHVTVLGVNGSKFRGKYMPTMDKSTFLALIDNKDLGANVVPLRHTQMRELQCLKLQHN